MPKKQKDISQVVAEMHSEIDALRGCDLEAFKNGMVNVTKEILVF